jgi:hypothetical protein
VSGREDKNAGVPHGERYFLLVNRGLMSCEIFFTPASGECARNFGTHDQRASPFFTSAPESVSLILVPAHRECTRDFLFELNLFLCRLFRIQDIKNRYL